MIPIERVWSVLRVYLRYVLHSVTIVGKKRVVKRIWLVYVYIYSRCSPVLSQDAGTLKCNLFPMVRLYFTVFSMLSDARLHFKRHWVQNKEVAISSYVSFATNQ